MKEDYKAVGKCKSKILETKQGPLEYAVMGEGPVILSVHGGPGGYDQGLIIGEFFRAHGYKILSVSRPGYLKTPLESGQTVEEQADLYALLFDHLNIEKAGLVHASAGGPSGYTFASKYPDRVNAHIAIDSVSMKYAPNISKTEELIFLNKYGMWITNFLTNHFPKMALTELLKAESTLDKNEMEERVSEIIKNKRDLEVFKVFVATAGGTRYDERKKGVKNDLDLFKEIDKVDLSGITAPTLIIHGDCDKDVAPAHAEYANSSIKNSEICWIPKGSHLSFFVSEVGEEAREKSIEFWDKHLK